VATPCHGTNQSQIHFATGGVGVNPLRNRFAAGELGINNLYKKRTCLYKKRPFPQNVLQIDSHPTNCKLVCGGLTPTPPVAKWIWD